MVHKQNKEKKMKGKNFYYTRKKRSKTTLLTLTHQTPNAAIFSLTNTHTNTLKQNLTLTHTNTRNIIETEVST